MDNDPQSYDEKTLVERVARGEAPAFETLFNNYWDHVYSFALLMTKSPASAQDISQEVFLAILKPEHSPYHYNQGPG